jgi:hypothetical protein
MQENNEILLKKKFTLIEFIGAKKKLLWEGWLDIS